MHKKLLDTLSPYETIVFVGGGTGGHIQPILSIVSEFRKQDSAREFCWIGGKNTQEEEAAKNMGITFLPIPILKLSTTRSPKICLYPFVLLHGILKARNLLSNEKRKTKNEQICIFSKGGPGSVAIGIAAWTLGIPLYIHESDTIPGRSNTLLGKIATKIFLGFESAKLYFNPEKCEVIGQILDPLFDPAIHQEPGIITWKTTKPHILVICGSQGARSVFEAILHQFSENNPYEWIIALGKLNQDMKADFNQGEDMESHEWMDQKTIAHLLTQTDIAISRGSATTLAEIDTFGIKKIIIPLPSAAKNHQYWNAREYEKNGDILLEQKNISQLTQTLKTLGQNSAPSKKL